jgi:hypothetical protein
MGPDVREHVAGIGPFAELHGVSLGTPVFKLKELRPDLQIADYTGFTETVEGYQVFYDYAHYWMLNEGVAPPPLARLRKVRATKVHTDLAEAEADWLELVRSAEAALEKRPTCYEVKNLGGGSICLWKDIPGHLSVKNLPVYAGRWDVEVTYSVDPPSFGILELERRRHPASSG